MRHFVLAFSLILSLVNLSANAQIPPRPEMREETATDIIAGKVLSTKSWLVPFHQGGYDRHYKVTMRITEVSKGDKEIGAVVEFTYKTAHSRLAGWSGNIGQSETILKNDTIEAYLSADSDGSLKLLEPNGFEHR